ncbi:CPBP family intramembrane glutamic endopeptidase [Corynebacterium sp. S7]
MVVTQTELEDSESSRSEKPFALAAVWIVLMAPLSLGLGALQPFTPVPYEVFPLIMLGPALAAAVCHLAFRGWFPPQARPSTKVVRMWVAVAVVSALCFTTMVVALPAGPYPFYPEGWSAVLGIPAVVFGLTIASWCEEVGYRGVMYRALAARWAPWLCVVVNGSFFGLAHLQYFGAGLVPVALFVLAAIFIDVVMVSLWSGQWWHRVLVAGAFHAIVNISMQMRGSEMVTVAPYAAMAGVLGVCAVVAYFLGRWLGIGDFHGVREERI